MPADGVLCYLAISAMFLSGVWLLPVDKSTVNAPFAGFQVLAVQVNEINSLGALLQELQTKYQVDVWSHSAVKGTFDVMVSPTQINDVLQLLKTRSANVSVKVFDVQRLLEEQVDRQAHQRKRRAISFSTVTRRYLKMGQIRQFLQKVRDNATHATVTLSNLGRSFEGRITPYVTIRHKSSGATTKPAVVIEAGIHAREWIAPAMALNIIYRLAFNPYDDPEIDQLLRNFDWIIIPVLNPDGYVFSHKNASTRLWRKTRTTMYASDPHCIGVDGNRNFGYEWSDTPYRGGSNNPCTDNYSGPRSFSEPETRHLKSMLLRLRDRIALYLSMHSFGQYFLYPWGYDSQAVLQDEDDLEEVGQRFSDLMWQRNRYYQVGSSAKVLYAAAGASDDYARGGAGIKFAFTVELSPSDSSPHGFLLPAHHISTVVNDHWPAFKGMVQTVWNKLNQSNGSFTSLLDNPNESLDNNAINTDLSLGDDPDYSAEAIDHRESNSQYAHEMDDNSAHYDGLTEVVIDGRTFHLNLNDPAITQWMQHYLEFMNYRRRYQGWRRRR